MCDTFNLNIISDEFSRRSNLGDCISRITEWTHENRPKLINDKTEFTVFASERQRQKITSTDISVDGIKVETADNIKYVGMWLYTLLLMKNRWHQCATR